MKLLGCLLLMHALPGKAQAPGGVSSSLALWLKADAGTTPATGTGNLMAWSNQYSGAGAMAVSIYGSPDFSATTPFNFNPCVQFTKSNGTGGDYLSLGADQTIQALYTALRLNDINRTNTHIATWEDVSFGFPSSGNGTLHGGSAAGLACYQENNISNYDPDFTGASVWRSNGAANAYNTTYTGNFQIVSAVGSGITTINRILGHQASNTGFDPSPRDWFGPVGEYIIYTGAQTTTQRNQIESYLGIKYGLTLAHDYLSSSGTTVWSLTTDPVYNTNIIGIARDDNSLLLQKEAKSENLPASDVLTVHLGTKTTLNAANTSTFTAGNNSFFMVGNNNAPVINTVYPHPERPAGICCRLQREWMVQQTNFTNPVVKLEFNLTGLGAGSINMANLRLLTDADGNFSNATILPASSTTISVVSATVTVAVNPAQFNSNRYFTLGSVNVATPLPVELLYFNAEAIDNRRVKLSWETASEINSDYFTVERSTDAMQWEALTPDVDAAGTSHVNQQYSLHDEQPYRGRSYYRLRQTDLDQSIYYSPIRDVELNGKLSVRAYPNPAGSMLTVLSSHVILELELINALGQQAFFEKGDGSTKRRDIGVGQLAAGLYVLRVYGPGGETTQLRIRVE